MTSPNIYSPNMNTPMAGHGTAMVGTRVVAAFKTAAVCIMSLREFEKSHQLTGSVRQRDRLSVWRTSISFGPGFFAGEHLVWIRESLRSDETFERRQPVLVVMGAIVGFATIFRSF